MAAAGASSISVTVRVRPFTIREAAQVTRNDDQTLFLGDGSLAGVPAPKLHKGIRPVIKVMDEKCLYGSSRTRHRSRVNTVAGYSTLQKTVPYTDSVDRQPGPRGSAQRTRRLRSTASSTTQPLRAMYTKPQPSLCWTVCWRDTMRPSLHMVLQVVEKHIPSRMFTHTPPLRLWRTELTCEQRNIAAARYNLPNYARAIREDSGSAG